VNLKPAKRTSAAGVVEILPSRFAGSYAVPVAKKTGLGAYSCPISKADPQYDTLTSSPAIPLTPANVPAAALPEKLSYR